MYPDSEKGNELKASILRDTQSFLIGLESGASNQQLKDLLHRIRERERRLLTEHGMILAPLMWKILHNRFANRRNKDIIDLSY